MSIPATIGPYVREPVEPKRSASCPQFRCTKVLEAVRELLTNKKVHFICHDDGTTRYKDVYVSVDAVKAHAKAKGMRIYKSYVYVPSEQLEVIVLTTIKPLPMNFPK